MSSIKVLLVLTALAVSGWSQILPDSLWQQANRAVAAEDYQQAISKYESILAQGFEHENLYFNLGNSYYRQDELGLAIWAYEKGLQFTPRQEDLVYNLAVAKTQIVDRIDVPEGLFFLELYSAFKNSYTVANLLVFGAIALFIAAGLFLSSRLLAVNNRIFKYGFSTAIVMAVLFHLVALDKYWELSDKQEGVIIPEITEAHSTPSGLGKVIFKVHEGLKVEITQNQDDWLEIILLDGKKGWVYSGAVRIL